MSARCALPQLLDAHRAALAACRRCGHDDAAVVPILSLASAPRVVLVGQAPGKTEVGDRRPFAGRAGKTLFRWLERAGVDEATARAEIYIAAITRCFPGPSLSGRGDRVPSPRERDLCKSWLDAELRLIRPALVIPVGRLAIDRFLGPEPLERVVGRVHEVRIPAGDPAHGSATDARAAAIPLPHPSGASSWPNLPGNRPLLERALALLGAELRAHGVVISTPRERRSA